MPDPKKLQSAYNKFKTATYWNSTGRCKGYGIANPGEAKQIDQYIADLVAGKTSTPPILSTFHGQGLVAMIDAGFAQIQTVTPPPAPPLTQADAMEIVRADGGIIEGTNVRKLVLSPIDEIKVG